MPHPLTTRPADNPVREVVDNSLRNLDIDTIDVLTKS